MRYLVLCALLSLAFLACTPTVGSTVPPDLVTARFDPAATPPDVPAPTDLAKDPNPPGLLAIPVSPTASAAEREFIEKFLNTLTGFPPDTPATANFDASLQPSSVNLGSVRVIDLTSRTPVALTPIYADVGSPPKGQITLAPPPPPCADQPGGWTIGHQYMVALIAGANGLTGLQGQQVVGSSAWGLLSSVNPLVTCPDNLADPNCRATTDLIPSDETDPARRIADQTTKAKQLEQIRQEYAPLIEMLTDQHTNRSDIVLLWKFTILDRPQATFDPANQVIPFPNNLATVPVDGGVRVNLPIPDGGSPLVQQLFEGLNRLDGFSTTAPIVSENSDPLPALTKGVLDPTTIVDGGTGVLNLELDGGIQPRIRPCLTDVPNGNCATFTTPDGGAPEQLQLIPTVPLLERKTYVAYFTTKLKDTQGNSVAPTTAFALMRNRYPLVDGSGNSTISTVPSQLAGDLEKARLVMKNGLDILETTGITREQLVLATVFTTQSEGSVLKRLRGVVNDPRYPATPVDFPVHPPNCHNCVGRIVVPNLLTGPDGVFDPGNPAPETIYFNVFIPSGTAPPQGWPVTIFGHGLTRARSDAFVLSFLFNQEGQAVIAIDAVWHGDRTICTGSAAFINLGINTDPACPQTATSDDAACANPASGPPTQFCCEDPSCPLFETSAGRCIAINPANRAPCDPGSITPPGTPPDIYCANRITPATPRGQGRCITNPDMTMSCEGGYFRLDSTPIGPVPCVSGQNLLNLTNLFATRDNFRQGAIDLTQLARVIQSNDPGSLNEQLAGNRLNGNQISYVGMSLGGLLGTLYTSVAPEIQNVVLNVPGSDLPTILLTSPTFRPAREAFIERLAEEGIMFGTPAFDDFVGVAKWAFDPADPINAAYGILNDPTVPRTRALIQYITDDQVIPNPTTEELLEAARHTVPTGKQVDYCLFNPPVCDPDLYPDPRNCPCPGGPDSPTCSIPPSGVYGRHGFLINFSPPPFRDSRTTRAQTQAVRYIKNPLDFSCTP